MKRLVIFLLVTGLLGTGVYFAYPMVTAYIKERNRPSFRQAEVVEGDIVSVVNATGTIQPVLRVSVGSFVSGPVKEIRVDYNSEVKKGDLLATIDPRIYEAAVARDQAALATRQAELARIEATLEQARNDERRAEDLRAENEGYISQAEMDKVHFGRLSLEAELRVAKAAILQAEANLENSTTNLGYTKIASPVDGVVIDRKIDPGQTLAASFQTPEMFIVAPDMRKTMRVFASVDETEIGRIREAQLRKEKVEFTVDAYPDDLFQGEVSQIRINPTTTQNVVTYPVVVDAANPDLKLLPGMTAEISFQIEAKKDIVKIPNTALRFYPLREYVRPEDHKIYDGVETAVARDDELEDDSQGEPSASEKIEANRGRDRRHVWVVDGDFLRAVEVVTGVSDNRYTEMVEGNLKVGDQLVIGVDKPGLGG